MEFHFVFALLHFLLFVVFLGAINATGYPLGIGVEIGGIVVFLAMIFHLLLGIGSAGKREWSRKTSEIVGVIMLSLFPVGTFIGYFFLQCTLWKKPGADKYRAVFPDEIVSEKEKRKSDKRALTSLLLMILLGGAILVVMSGRLI